ncbi:MAG: sulfite exporter TauE/SafE family protein [Candidatus Eiseniibacteriota bacterium]
MSVLEYTLLVAAGSILAGFSGALTGLGGGVVIVPLLTLVFGVDIRYAVGASLISVIATSSGAAVHYLREGFTNLRLAMLLEVATTLGAVGGAALAGVLPTHVVAIVFGVVLLLSAFGSARPAPERDAEHYQVRRVPLGFGLMSVAGALSGLLGIGSGALKVLAMDGAMELPFKASTATSSLMIGVTAAASAGVYLRHGYIDPGLAMPVMLGVLAGALLGARVFRSAPARPLRIVFALVTVAIGIEMILNGLRRSL